MWVNGWERQPNKDGMYLVHHSFGHVGCCEFTVDGGWNTHHDRDGVLCTDHRIDETAFARWYEAEEPDPVPELARKAWFSEKKTWREADEDLQG